MVTPSPLSSASTWQVYWSFCMSADSVISISKSDGSRPVAASTRQIDCFTSCRLKWYGERLTATRTGGRLASCHALACRQAVRMTQSVSSTIRPLSSASRMNRSGARSPILGCIQRTSASTLLTLPESRSTFGWYWRMNSLRSTASLRSDSSVTLSLACSFILLSNSL